MTTDMMRRAFLKAAPVAAAAVAAPAVAAQIETPRAQVDRLGSELSRALAQFDNGDFHAKVFAANQPYGGVQLVLDNFHETQEEKVRRMVRMLQFEMSKLPTVQTAGGAVHEIDVGGGCYLRVGAQGRDDRVVVVGFIPTLGAPAYEPREV